MNDPDPPQRPWLATLLLGCVVALLAAVALLVCGSVAVIVALTALGQSLDQTFDNIAEELEEAE